MINLTNNFFRKSQLYYGTAKNFSSLKVQLPEYKVHNLNLKDLPKTTQTNKDELLSYYKEIAGLRRMEVTMDNLYKQREIRGFCHLYDGQEAICLGIEKACNLDDCLITAYRDHCQARVRGYSVHEIMAEMMGKKTGATKGKGGSMHFYRKAGNFYGGHGIVGAQTAMGAGLAFALKYKNMPNVSITMYGDGASNQGQLFEAANIAKLWSLPCLFVCENNEFGMGTSNERASANTDFYTKLDMAKIPGLVIDGHNIFAVREGFKFAKDYAVKNGPLCIEMKTYRYHGHSMSDPGVTYRSREDVSNVRKNRDCVNYVKQLLLDNKYASEDEIKAIDKEIKAEVDNAVQKARDDPYPDEADLIKGTYTDNEANFIRDVEYTTSFFPGGAKY